tara:strand:+ start:146 stop:541 length:396 start_codon:yes stop_codon:yes gene_type:complete
MENITLENREDLTTLLNTSKYEYIILKFKAIWCKPCKVIKSYVDQCVNNKIKELNEKGKKNVFLFIEVDIDECFDLYSYLKKMKRLNGVPSILFYSKSVYENIEDEYKYIPQMSISGIQENRIKKLFDLIE